MPGTPFAPGRRTLGPRAIAVVCLGIACACAAIVFVILYKLDVRYPVAAVRSSAIPTAVPQPAAPSAPTNRQSETTAVADAPDPIARTHAELLALEQLGTRNYIEFSLARSTDFQPVGPLQIRVWRIDSDHNAVQVSVLSDQQRIDYKRLKLNQRASIPTAYAQGLEMVVNSITRNQISGYVSEPKDKTRQLPQDPNQTVVKVP
jgi:hypothetical protein